MLVLLHPIPVKYLNRLNATDRARIKFALERLEKEPPEGDIRPIVGQPGYFRVRIGSYRAFYQIRNDIIYITHIELRGQAYKKKNRGER